MLKPPTAQTMLLQQLRAAQRDSRAGWVNARKLALALHITPNALHQAVCRLRRHGWTIRTSDRASLGGLHYTLADRPMRPADNWLTPRTNLPRPAADRPPPFMRPEYRNLDTSAAPPRGGVD